MKKHLLMICMVAAGIHAVCQQMENSLSGILKSIQEKNKNNPQGAAALSQLSQNIKNMIEGKLSSLYKCSAVWTKGTDAEIQVYGLPFDDYKKIYDEIWPDAWRLHTLDVHIVDNTALYTAVWRQSKHNEIQVYGWDFANYKKKYDELWSQGWRLHILKNYYLKGKPLWTAVWKKDGNLPEVQVYAWEFNDYKKKYDELWKDGWRLHILTTTPLGNKLLYSAVWKKTNANEVQVYGWDYSSFRKKYDELWKEGWRLHILNNNLVDGQVKYTAVWRQPSVPAPDEIQLYYEEFNIFKPRYDELWKQGWRLKILDVAETTLVPPGGIKSIYFGNN